MRRLLPFIVALVVAAPPTAYAALSATKLTGTTGPGFTITVKKAGTKVAVVNPLREPGMERYWIPSNVESARLDLRGALPRLRPRAG